MNPNIPLETPDTNTNSYTNSYTNELIDDLINTDSASSLGQSEHVFTDDTIRPPDSVFTGRLINDLGNINLDDDLENALRLSEEEYFRNQHYDETIRVNSIESVNSDNSFVNSSDNLSNNLSVNSYVNSFGDNDKDLKEAILLSQEAMRLEEEREAIALIKEQEALEEIKKLELLSNRKRSLEIFFPRIKNLARISTSIGGYKDTETNYEKLISDILNEYLLGNIDMIYMSEQEYTEIYKIIDSYYLIPNERGAKTIIPWSEDQVLRSIFLK